MKLTESIRSDLALLDQTQLNEVDITQPINLAGQGASKAERKEYVRIINAVLREYPHILFDEEVSALKQYKDFIAGKVSTLDRSTVEHAATIVKYYGRLVN